jgi:hypothetical protein
MKDKDLINKIVMAAKKQPMPVKMPNKNDSISIKREEPWKAPTGAAAYLATVNQPSGAHVPKKNREKTKQEMKKKLRNDWDNL